MIPSIPLKPVPPAPALDIEIGRQEMQRKIAMPPAEEMAKLGIQQMSAHVSPSIVPAKVVSEFLERLGHRDRAGLDEWLHRACTRYTNEHGMWRSLVSDRDRFQREVLPALDKLGCGLESWVAVLRNAGLWGGV